MESTLGIWAHRTGFRMALEAFGRCEAIRFAPPIASDSSLRVWVKFGSSPKQFRIVHEKYGLCIRITDMVWCHPKIIQDYVK